MTLADVIYRESLDLPTERAQEVIDFIGFIKSRYSGTKPVMSPMHATKSWESRVFAVAGTLGDDFPDDIDDTDLGQDAPREPLE
ncbi:MAG: DUF2281 domain-containing protein [Pseudomonadota bacterium]